MPESAAPLERVAGLGCMRLSTDAARDHDRAIAVIHAALDGGVRWLDSADAYCWDDTERGHNERLIREALDRWDGDRAAVTVATKGGMLRPKRANGAAPWLPCGRAKHLREVCEASLRALAVERIDVYQLHAPDPRTALATSVRALRKLQQQGKIRDIGLCNVNRAQLLEAQAIAPIASVQLSLSLYDDAAIRGGVASYCREQGIRLIAHRPLGGVLKARRLAQRAPLRAIAERLNCSPQIVALAWLQQLDPTILPLPGATRVVTASAIGQLLALDWDTLLRDDERDALEALFPAGRQLRIPLSQRQPPADAEGDVVLLMGIPGAGKSEAAEAYMARGYQRLNRDEHGGRLAGLLPLLDAGLQAGQRQWVLDNTYPERRVRNRVIELAWRYRVPVRSVWCDTSLADAQINAVRRLIQRYGKLPQPDDLKELGKEDPHAFGPRAQFRYEQTFEPPTEEEGFASIERRAFERRAQPGHDGRALIVAVEGVLRRSLAGERSPRSPEDVAIFPERAVRLREHQARGYRLLGISWQPQIAAGGVSRAQVEATLAHSWQLLGVALKVAYCPHPPGPPVCWCRTPLPGLVVDFFERYRLDPTTCILVGSASAEKLLAERTGVTYVDAERFFARP